MRAAIVKPNAKEIVIMSAIAHLTGSANSTSGSIRPVIDIPLDILLNRKIMNRIKDFIGDTSAVSDTYIRHYLDHHDFELLSDTDVSIRPTPKPPAIEPTRGRRGCNGAVYRTTFY